MHRRRHGHSRRHPGAGTWAGVGWRGSLCHCPAARTCTALARRRAAIRGISAVGGVLQRVLWRAGPGHNPPFEMVPKLQSVKSDEWLVYGEQIETRSASTRPIIVSPFAFQHGQEQYVLVREIGTKCHLWFYGRVGSAQGYPRRRPLPLLRHGRAARWVSRVRSRESFRFAWFASRGQPPGREHFVPLSVILITAGR